MRIPIFCFCLLSLALFSWAYLTLPRAEGAPTEDLISRLLPLIRAAESSGYSGALGDDGVSIGLYQIGPGVLRDFNLAQGTDYSPRDLFDPMLNEYIARWHLSRINSRLAERGLGGNIPCLIYAYNYGWGRLRDAGFAVPASALHHPNLIYRALLRGEWPEIN